MSKLSQTICVNFTVNTPSPQNTSSNQNIATGKWFCYCLGISYIPLLGIRMFTRSTQTNWKDKKLIHFSLPGGKGSFSKRK